ncbi:hypothetical protein [Roseibacillus persicicus]|uniref:Uncharacterized protein n=1 Tax=Roseibacillus persicicus TaxID=454148 RepID=A0A918TQ14_9BACT|nr:hypothetical protein [Roseibacillus persicicus]MDQ8191064.1 hypothetical protein [Roseibacillus persicicus]GHC56675.1 hypothetical protein GCM10007100_24320 [Roseibacillus persicicus]
MSAVPISELRRQLRERFPAAHEDRPAAESYQLRGMPPLPKGTITELVTPPSVSGSSLLLSQLLEDEPENRELPLALIDPGDHFDPASYRPRRPLLWLRSANPKKSLQAADLLVRDGNIPLVLLDCSLTPLRELRQIPSSSWYRLRTLAESSGTSLLALTPAPLIAAAAARYELENSFSLHDLSQLRNQLFTKLQSHPLKTQTILTSHG